MIDGIGNMPNESLELEDSEWEHCDFDPHLLEIYEAWKVDPKIPANGITYWEDNTLRAHVIVRLGDERAPEKIPCFEPTVTIGNIVTGSIAVKDIPTIFANREQRSFFSLKAATYLQLDLHNSVHEIRCTPGILKANSFAGLDGTDVIVGIVDSGCDFQHRSFLKGDGTTRLLFLWDQNDGPHPKDPKVPQPYGYGREFTKDDIDEALRQTEEDPYDSLGYEPDPASHGTHVMDVAAGSGAVKGVAPNADLVFVHLKSDGEIFLGTSRHLLEAVHYVFEKAKEMGKPAVVNVSLSSFGGPHDGTTLVEKGFENLLSEPGRQIVLSAGNSFTKQIHRDDTVRQETPVEIAWELDARCQKNEMEVWYEGKRALEVTLISPGGRRLGPVSLGKTFNILRSRRRIGRISHRRMDPNNDQNQIDVRLPSEPGTWTVRLTTQELTGVPFHAWIEQGDRGLARFTNGSSASFTLGSICCGKTPITVGAYDTFRATYLAQPYEATSAGPTRDERAKPDVSAPGVSIVAAKAKGEAQALVFETSEGEVKRLTPAETFHMSGTSVAAPHVAGVVALMFQRARNLGLPDLEPNRVREILRETARRDPSSGKEWDQRLGAGRIDGLAALKKLEKEPPGGGGDGGGRRTREERAEKTGLESVPEDTPAYATPDPSGRDTRFEEIDGRLSRMESALGAMHVMLITFMERIGPDDGPPPLPPPGGNGSGGLRPD